MENKYRQYAKEVMPQVVEFRHDLHRHPEVSMQEYRTTEKVCEWLDRVGVPYRRTGEVGVVADLKGTKGESDKMVMLRADMDALSIQEETGLDYSSVNEGMMHACGHDTHTAMLAGTVEVLNKLKDQFAGTVRFVFQPGEEVGKGADYMIEHGVMEGVDMAMGLHIQGLAPVGQLSMHDGAAMASCDEFRIYVHGKGSHGAAPQNGRDATVAAASLVMNLQTMVSREFDPTEPVLVTVGQSHSGSRFNIISEEAYLDGTCRVFNREIYAKLPEVMERIAKNTCAALGCTCDVEFYHLTKPLVNDHDTYELLKASALKVVDEVPDCGTTMGGEDFSSYMEFAPSAFIHLGADGGYQNHSPHVDFKDDSFETGITVEVQFALDALAKLNGETAE